MRVLLERAVALAIQCDGWTDVCGRGIVNFMITTPTPLLWDSFDRGTERETGSFVATNVIDIIQKVGPEKFLIFICDSPNKMVTARNLVVQAFPHMEAVGCSCHYLQNLFKDLLNLAFFKKIHVQCKNAVKEIKGSHVKLAAFREAQKASEPSRQISLKLPPNTRFGYSVLTMKSLVANKGPPTGYRDSS